MKINDTPKRTSNNYNINNYEIDSSLIDREINSFKNYKLTDVKLNEINSDINTKYGLGDSIINQIKDKSNFSYEVIPPKDGIIEFDLDKNNDSLVDYIKLIIPDNKKISLTIIYKSSKKGSFYHNGLIEIVSSNNSNANIVLINALNKESINLVSINNTCLDSSKLVFNIVDIGGSKSISNYYTNLKEDNSKSTLNSIYLGSREEEIDINYIVECFGKNTETYINVEGALNDKARKNFKGTIDFKKGSSKSIGEESEYCTLLSNECKSKSLPMLLCSEEDVIGSHSSASGKVDEDILFYLMSRGISKKDATRLLIKSRFNKVLSSISNEDIKCYIDKLIDEEI